MFFSHKNNGNERHGTVIAALGLNPSQLTSGHIKNLEKEFGCAFETGELLIWVEASEERAEQIFDTLRRRHSPF